MKVSMIEIKDLAAQIVWDADYDLTLYSMDVGHVVEIALDECTPEYYDSHDRKNLELELTSQYEEMYDTLTEEL